MEQPIPTVTREDIYRIIKRDFPENQREEAQKIVDEYRKEDYEREHNRVKAAALKNADGKVEQLKREINRAKTDYRDVLLSAEYPLCAKRMFDKNYDNEKEKIYEEDWKQYNEWFTKQ